MLPGSCTGHLLREEHPERRQDRLVCRFVGFVGRISIRSVRVAVWNNLAVWHHPFLFRLRGGKEGVLKAVLASLPMFVVWFAWVFLSDGALQRVSSEVGHARRSLVE